MKQITIIGNLGADAVRRLSAAGKELITFNVAVNAGEQTIWFGVVMNMRENLLPYLVKGQCVSVCGDLQPRVYNGNLDLSINADRVELCGKAPSKEETLV